MKLLAKYEKRFAQADGYDISHISHIPHHQSNNNDVSNDVGVQEVVRNSTYCTSGVLASGCHYFVI
jgi:hypothetical protein